MVHLVKVRIARAWMETPDIRVLELAPQEAVALPMVSAGSHIDVHMPNGLVRQYSICNGPGESGFYRIAVKLEARSRGGSRSMHQDLEPGDALSISQPRNHFALSEIAGEHLLVAGGIGITPILAMARALAERGSPFRLIYFVRGPEHVVFNDALSDGRLAKHLVLHTGLSADQTAMELTRDIVSSGDNSHLYVCGPAAFMEAALTIAVAAGWAPERLHREYFSALVDETVSKGAFEVEARRTGRTVSVAADETIVAALARDGINVDVSCEQGVCGTCLTVVLDGTPDHQDMYLTDAEKARNDRMCLCVSRARSARLVLDL
ncbi:PDR/VanB family oxidoreductase [Roseomonas mucosa]|nr:PDR/VanB family oxidoreductase [Roseomonas mucosa]